MHLKKYSAKTLSTAGLAMALLLSAAGLLTGKSLQLQIKDSPVLKKITGLFTTYTQHPAERVYVQTDKPLYAPGETIWFQAYVVNVADGKPSDQSSIIHVQLMNPKGGVDQELKLIADNGSAGGDFTLPQGNPGGLYKLKAFTMYQQNEPGNLLFEKELTVQQVILPHLKMKLDFEKKAYGPGDEVKATVQFNTLENKPLANKPVTWIMNLDGVKNQSGKAKTDWDGKVEVKAKLPAGLNTIDGLLGALIEYNGQTESITRSVPIVLNKITMDFFPEGGNMVANLNSRVAFRALNEFSKAADVDGEIVDDQGNKVASFSSYHMGMGSFSFTPVPGHKYSARITRPEGIKDSYTLPMAITAGHTMKLTQDAVNNMLEVTVNSTFTEELSIVAYVRDKIYYQGSFDASAGENHLDIPLSKFPMGVAKVTLFDSKGLPLAERLVFTNKKKQLHIAVTTNKDRYQPREKVDMQLKATDENGKPVAANLSLALVDDKLLSFADDRSGTMMSRLFLEPELKDKVEEASFYFDPNEPKADRALDLLMMTAGWRRYTWQQIADGHPYNINIQPEKAVFAGHVYNENKDSVKHKKISLTTGGKEFFATTDDNGAFRFRLKKLAGEALIKVVYSSFNYIAASRTAFDTNISIVVGPIYDQVYEVQATGGFAANRIYREEVMLAPLANYATTIQVRGMRSAKSKPGPDLDPQIKKDDDAQPIKAGYKINLDSGRVTNIQHDYYYVTREFPAPIYKERQPGEERTDFRSTIYWKGGITTDDNGNASVSFYTSDDITAFRATAEGIGGGLVGHSEQLFYTQLPFSISAKIPNTASCGDNISLPITLINHTQQAIMGELNINAPASWQANASSSGIYGMQVAPGGSQTMFVDYKVINKPGKDTIRIHFKGLGASDELVQPVMTLEKGFPGMISFSGEEKDKTYSFNLGAVVDGTLHCSFTAYPSALSETMKGLDAILREPYGCFEQTSSSNYPNIMALEYMKETGEVNKDIQTRATALLDAGYNRLTSFETKEKGYEWFGSLPAHEALTAYGLMEFNDMKNVYGKVDQDMVDRTAGWLMKRRDGKGGFKRDGKALDAFGRASEEVTNAYIIYALSEAGYTNIKPELDAAVTKAENSNDAYQLALVANALFTLKDERAAGILKKLLALQTADGSWKGAQSITMSGTRELSIETTSLTMLAMLKDQAPNRQRLEKGAKYIISSRDGSGGFGSTQTTVLALKALIKFSRFSKRTRESGTVVLYIDGKEAGMQKYGEGQSGEINIIGLEKYLTPGKHNLRVKYKDVKYPLPYSIAVNWRNAAPEADPECAVKLTTTLSSAEVKAGETVRLTTTLKNVTHNGQPSTVAIIGIPSGLSPQPWQLKELQEKGVYDYYEIKDNNVIAYYRQMQPDEVRTISLDLKADVPGSYDAPASVGYLYYSAENKSWCQAGRITVK